jgi:hypothetical protein
MTPIEEEIDNETKTHYRNRCHYTDYYFSRSKHPGRDVAFLFLAIADVSNYPHPFDDAHRGCHRVYHRESDEKRTKAGPTVTSRKKVFALVFRMFKF